MLVCKNGTRILQPGDAMPNLVNAKDIYVDFETTSGDPTKKSTNPWHNCNICGVAVTVDHAPYAWYMPIRHNFDSSGLTNIQPEYVINWTRHLVDSAANVGGRWINSNVKYDATVLHRELGRQWKPPETLQLLDTATLARIIDSDRFTYGLKTLSKAWLGEDISAYENALQPYLGRHNKDYGNIPIDILGEYAGQDVLSNRKLFWYLDANCPDDCRRVWNMEIAITSVLLGVEFNGMRIEPTELVKREYISRLQMQQIQRQIADVIGYVIEPNNDKDCFDVLCNSYNLPVLGWTENGNPSFAKGVLKQYLAIPGAPVDVIKWILQYRKLKTLVGLFLEPYQVLHVDNRLHGSYRQTLKTGRMGMTEPNLQQVPTAAKELLLADEGEVLLSIDYSQIEFRFIVHYIKDRKFIRDYWDNPDTDAHSWVAEECHIDRQPAKTVNFLVGFGGGKNLTIATLAKDEKLTAELLEKVKHLPEDKQREAFSVLSGKHATEVYNRYHHTLPTLKPTSKRVENVARSRGYVFTLYRRRRHLPRERAHIAFNTLNQGTAADLLKDRLLNVVRAAKGTGIRVLGLVHDEFLFSVPKTIFSERLVSEILFILENPDIDVSVPIRASAGWSDKNWMEANKDETRNPARLQSVDEFQILDSGAVRETCKIPVRPDWI